ncbi:uncharacterized protein LOC133742858 [Rosa rugosa]|uniref:uncharacterized protein LOC133742858 n=1 Tax=Rosa rugosa TaxID=74645 RepID=UPI002B40688D|nr:uncharacterized protein LOC133742858 [Rosa rugosa]
MAYFQNDDLEYVVNDYNGDVVEFKEDNDALTDNHPCRSLEVVDDDDFEDDLDSECLQVEKGKSSYDFHYNTRLVRSTIVHFQLIAPEILVLDACHINMLLCTDIGIECLNCDGHIMASSWGVSTASIWITIALFISAFKQGGVRAAGATLVIWDDRRISEHLRDLCSKNDLGCWHDHSLVQISTMAVKKNLLVAGGFQGELICKHMKQPGVAFCSKLTTDENAITNAVDIFRNPTTPLLVPMVSYSLGDSADCFIADAQSGKTMCRFLIYFLLYVGCRWPQRALTLLLFLSLAPGWMNLGYWEPRRYLQAMGHKEPVRVPSCVEGKNGSNKSYKLTSGGRFMAMAEPADFVHIIDTQSGYAKGRD